MRSQCINTELIRVFVSVLCVIFFVICSSNEMKLEYHISFDDSALNGHKIDSLETHTGVHTNTQICTENVNVVKSFSRKNVNAIFVLRSPSAHSKTNSQWLEWMQKKKRMKNGNICIEKT